MNTELVLRHLPGRALLAALASGFILCLCATGLRAQTVTYLYDDLGRLNRVIDEQGNVATYNYDAVGNILSIERGDGGCPVAPPTISQVTSGPCVAGTICAITIDGNSLLGAGVSTGNPQAAMTDCQGDCTRITCMLNISLSATPGPLSFSVTTSLGAAQGTVDILPGFTTISTPTVIGPTDARFDLTNLTIDGTQVVIDGEHTFESLTVKNGAVVTHPPSTSTTTSKLDVTVNAALSVDATSRIDVSGKGLLGGRSGDNANDTGRTLGNTTTGGSTARNGGSFGGLGGIGNVGGSANGVYGDFRNPVEPGSGGGGQTDCGATGGNGGGVIQIAAGTTTVEGLMVADGGAGSNTCGGGGSGGSIRLQTGTLSGAGSLRANGGGAANASFSAGGGGGRIAVFYTDATGFDFGSSVARGGSGRNGGAGTIYLKQSTQAHGDLVIDNGGLTAPSGSTPLRAIGPGTSTVLSAALLTDSAAALRTPDPATGELGLIGLELNPDTTQNQTFTVIDNSATTLTIDTGDGDLTTVAMAGDPYLGVYTFDSLTARNGGKMSTADQCVVLGTIETTGGSVSCNNLMQSAALVDSVVTLARAASPMSQVVAEGRSRAQLSELVAQWRSSAAHFGATAGEAIIGSVAHLGHSLPRDGRVLGARAAANAAQLVWQIPEEGRASLSFGMYRMKQPSSSGSAARAYASSGVLSTNSSLPATQTYLPMARLKSASRRPASNRRFDTFPLVRSDLPVQMQIVRSV